MNRNGMGVIGLVALVALTLVGVLASAAQAGEWTLEGQTFKTLALSEEKVTGAGKGTTAFQLPEAELAVSCASQALVGSIVQGGTGLATIELDKCQVTNLEEEPVEGCEVVDPLVMKLTSGLVETGAGGMYDELLAEKEKPFVSIESKGAECPLPGVLKLTGSAAGQGEETQKTAQAFAFSQKAAESTGSSLMNGAETAYMVGSTSVQLSGKNAGKAWGPLRAFFDSDPVAPDFGSVKVGQSVQMGIKFTYLGSLLSEQVTEGIISNPNKKDFTSVSDTCKRAYFAGETCEVTVKFAPSEANTRTATLTLKEVGVLGRTIVVNMKGLGT